MSIIEQKDQK